MDDLLEKPQKVTVKSNPEDDEADQSSGDEDGGLDWTKLPTGIAGRPIIPKRGEKDFEPAAGGESGWQRYNLDRARTAMFDALRATRAISSKSASYGVWYPSLGRTHITVARGVHFSSMGHSVARPSSSVTQNKTPKRLELLPEESLFLIEKGALFCWKNLSELPIPVSDEEDAVLGAPMSVQQAFAEMIGKEDLSLEKYQVFSYLKRLGYVVTRAKPPSPGYPQPEPYPLQKSKQPSLIRRIFMRVRNFLSFIISALPRPAFDWWRPITHHPRRHKNMSYSAVCSSLRFFASGHSVPLQPPPPPQPQSPYEIFYHLYKPSTPFKKTSPPPPDFHIVVVNARSTPMPTLAELTSLYNVLPTIPPPLPRQRRPPQTSASTPGSALPATNSTQATQTTNTTTTPGSQARPPNPTSSPSPPLFRSIFSFVPFLPSNPPDTTPGAPGAPPRKINPFMALRQGNKTVVIAAVDAGAISFFRFGEGNFEEWPMVQA